ncbi:MAG: ribokinase [Bacillota bacterium]|jgi:ribokinase|nr:ribokinase [Bacillota bacterium]HOA90590.1 ribokinase [Bacillota bacterium]HOP54689.1 ribokinase [Bacillota bacterium]HPQ10795.1 ribokinase [Bacillota bacterium]HPT60102.1 ribokinase [Bacillota bacterium]
MAEQKAKILVVGSFMMDLVVRTPRVPENGETIIGTSFNRFPGGKGANQAVAAARLGGAVTMAGKVGSDDFGDEFLSVLASEGINTAYILRDSQAATGVGFITLDHAGNNRIVVVPGANLRYSVQDLAQIESLIKDSDILIMQLEMDMSVIEHAVELAGRYQVPVILNPAPARALNDELLRGVTYLTPNETEAEILTGVKVTSIDRAKEAAEALLEKGVKTVVLTLAEKGALVASNAGATHVSGFSVQPVDTVAAGDAFNGAFAVAISKGKSLVEACRFANAVGAIAVTRPGAIPSLPSAAEVERFLAGQTS